MPSFKAFEKRNKTLLVEYKNQFKSNKFSDKRIGENDQNLSLEDKMFKRFVAERKKPREKKTNKFNLNDDENDNFALDSEPVEELTHFGQSLSQIEKFEKVDLSDEDEDNDDPLDIDKGRINAKIVSENFFGGFQDKDDPEARKKNRKQWIDEMIAKSKQIKYERQKEKDITLDLTEKLDKEWKDLIPIVGLASAKDRMEKEKQEQIDRNKKPDDYDVLVRSLHFDHKAQPTNRLKTQEEIEKEEAEKLKKNEEELKERMNNEIEEVEEDTKEKNRFKKKVTKYNSTSVDDMDFNEPEYLQMWNNDIKRNENEQEEENKDKVKNGADKSESENEEDDEEEEEEDEEDEEDEDDEESKDDESSTGDNELENKWLNTFKSVCQKLNSKSIDLNKFEKLIRSIIEKLDPSLDVKNKERLCLLTQNLIEYYKSLFPNTESTKTIDYNLVQLLTSLIFELTFKYGNKSTKKDPSLFVGLFKKILSNLNEEYIGLKMKDKRFPVLGNMFVFKLISNVFPTSDFRHQISTPCLLIMTRYLTECSVGTIGDCFRGSFLCNLCHEFIDVSKRFIPECVQYLNGILYLSINWKEVDSKLNDYDLSTIYESFKKTKLRLNPSQKTDKLEDLSLTKISCLESTKADNTKLASLLAYNLDVLKAFVNTYSELVSFPEIFHVTKLLLNLLPVDLYPTQLKERVNDLKTMIEENITDNSRDYLKYLSKKPVASKLYEPKVETKSKFDPRHHNSVISEKQLMRRKYKKELKSAIKEIRQDNQFIARVQLGEQLEKDAKRSRKVKEIMGSLASQEGEYQKMKRQKN